MAKPDQTYADFDFGNARSLDPVDVINTDSIVFVWARPGAVENAPRGPYQSR